MVLIGLDLKHLQRYGNDARRKSDSDHSKALQIHHNKTPKCLGVFYAVTIAVQTLINIHPA